MGDINRGQECLISSLLVVGFVVMRGINYEDNKLINYE
jgi:hypothetical protein